MKLFKSAIGRWVLPLFLVLLSIVPIGSAQTSQPNIVVILTDDLDRGVFEKDTRIPSLLTQNGTTFDKHFVELSLCCPSRTSTLRGQYAHNTQIYTNSPTTPTPGGFQTVYADGLESSTIATWLQSAGYRTALFGKYLNGYPSTASPNYIPPGWTHFVSPNGGSPYSEYNYSLNQNGTTVSYGSSASDYLVDVLSNKAATFINNTVKNFPNKPFFLYIAPYKPHSPATPPNRYIGVYSGAKAPRTPSFNEADVSLKPAWINELPLLNSTQIAAIDTLYEKRRESLLAVDDLVQNVIDTLKANNVYNNTYIFFTSDNGFHQGQHRLKSGKNTAYEEDLRVPLVVVGPGVPAGQVVSHFTANIDLAPTFADLGGATAPSFVDGRSLVPFLKGQTPSVWRLALLNEHKGPSGLTYSTTDGLLEPPDPADTTTAGQAPAYLGLRTKPVITTSVKTYGPLNYVAYDTGEHELYDVGANPAQLGNSFNAFTANDPDLQKKLDKWINSLKSASGQALRDAEQTLP